MEAAKAARAGAVQAEEAARTTEHGE